MWTVCSDSREASPLCPGSLLTHPPPSCAAPKTKPSSSLQPPSLCLLGPTFLPTMPAAAVLLKTAGLLGHQVLRCDAEMAKNKY